MAEMEEPKTKDDIKQLLKHLEDEHRKANISDTTYKELKEKYKAQMSYMDNSVADEGAPPMEEETPEQAAARMAAAPAPTEAAPEGEGEEKKGGFLGKIKLPSLGKKAPAQAAPAPVPVAAPAASNDSAAMIEIEKIKTMLDAIRDQKKSTDESVQSIFESIGEVRSMAIQSDANDREINSKLERITDDVTTLRPKDIEKKFNQINEALEKYQLTIEKMQAKTDDMAVNLNKLMENFKIIGNMENLANINTNVQSKLSDIQEATNYTERLASKAEKLYIDLKMELEDIVIYKSKQEALDEAMRDVLKTIDGINTKFDNYTTKKDIEAERQDIMILGKETETLKNTLALVQTNVPEPILNLRKEREDVNIFLDSLEEQYKSRTINAADYEMIKKKNLDKLKVLNMALEKEWKNFERLVEKAKNLPPPPPPVEEAPTPEEESLVPQPPTPAEEEVKKEENEMLQETKEEPVKQEAPTQETASANPMIEEIKKEVNAPEKPEGKILPRGSDEEMMKDIKEQLASDEKEPQPEAPKTETVKTPELPAPSNPDAPVAPAAASEAPKKKEKKKFLNLPF